MTTNHVVRVREPDLLLKSFEVVKELRTHLSFEQFQSLVREAEMRDGFQLVALMADDNVVAVMGYRILFDLAHGKHLYVDDLVTSHLHRGKGHGAVLLKYAEKVSKENSCQLLCLCTGVENHDAKRFYEREGLTLRSVAYKKTLTPAST